MCSDAFPSEPVEGAPGVVKVQSRLMTTGGEEINTGANASAEGGGEDAVDDSVETIDAIEYTFKLQSFDMDKATLKGWLKTYFQSIRKAKKEAGVPQEQIKEFMAGAPDAAKFLLGKAKELEMFINEDFDDKGAVCFREWSEKGNIYYYIKDGLKVVRC
ncbi:hypothetical protein CTAYLR_002733 [Chrysophaeum taylorii]|uniref:TCTP domain-containing protein n=1 Tax=Chrysophaeum taylorii TaxID=2483200 RepID=A0AAD7XHU0_9STRA|nr:hypothetical protein CTAYLR_002733 [Chrysophaeum taylorii]